MDGLLEDLDAAELMEWAAWERLTGPLGKVRQDLQMAQACCLLANCYRDTEKRRQPFELEDFLLFPSPWFGKGQRHKAAQTPEQMLAVFQALAQAQAAREA